ncbi:MAG: NAD-dependent epimerase/dehydratase family protein [Pseudomonadota bacterium]
MRIAIFGGDGFIGWPTALHLSDAGHDVAIVDNLSRRWIDTELGVQSLTPMDSIQERTRIWREVSDNTITFQLLDMAGEYERLKGWLADYRPDAVVHLAQQRAAPYSMKSDRHKSYTVNNNVNATHNLLNALVETNVDAHLVHMGTMGVYGYSTIGATIPEGYLSVDVHLDETRRAQQDILYPANPGSIYHMTKCLDQLLFQFYAKNDHLRITDLHQGIVWGTHTNQTRRHEQLINRFDYDGDYGTVLNRFLIQAAIGYPLTVHGTGGQTRAFIHIQDSVRCIELALANPPTAGERTKIFNQMTETHRVRDLAEMVAEIAGGQVNYVPNPRNEADENDLEVSNAQFLALGLDPITLRAGLLDEIIEVAKKYAPRIDPTRIPCTSAWTRDISTRLQEASTVLDVSFDADAGATSSAESRELGG